MANKNVLVAVPAKLDMPKPLWALMTHNLGLLERNNPGFNVKLCVFTDMFTKGPDERSIFTKPAKARNALVDMHVLTDPSLDYVLWLDADIVWYTPDLILRLHACNPDGVTAPMVLIERTGQYTDDFFYDVAAFAESGQPVYAEGPHFGNVAHKPPYFKSELDVVPCDSVGCAYLIDAAVHRTGVRFEPTPFTDHFPVIRKAIEMGLPVVTARHVVVYHACLPKYGEAWHSEPMEIWEGFDFDAYGLTVTPGMRPDAGRPAEAPKPKKGVTPRLRPQQQPPAARQQAIVRRRR